MGAAAAVEEDLGGGGTTMAVAVPWYEQWVSKPRQMMM